MVRKPASHRKPCSTPRRQLLLPGTSQSGGNHMGKLIVRERTARYRRRAELRRLCERAALRPERRLPARRERLRRAVCQGLCRGNALCAAALQVQNGAHAIRSRGRHDPNGFRSVLRLRGLELPPLRLGELSVSPNNKKAFRDLLSVVERFFNIQGRFPAQYWRTTATTLPSTSHSRPSMGW